ncbi:tetratricopeptide repeat protein [Meridianimarinicoccus sp. MJW13]|uniref:tetratricopeptide repeat protein n=1 Tax=Meridianimarinicoccus sp. MJW13 TaxID=2720031 RepID=UPI0018681A2E|nr:tetratricopeptide repeat protein [Fluviibacterium sp. MJW13]
MQTDLFGSDVSLDTSTAVEAWNALQLAFLAHGASAPDHLGATLKAAPEFALGHATKGLFLLLLGRRELIPTAREALQAARQGRADSARERAFIDALAAWLDGSPARAADRVESVLDTDPTDTLALKISHAIRFILGHKGRMLARLNTALPRIGEDHAARGYLMGCHAFALEENGHFAEARKSGEAGLERAADDAWGLHAVAHVHDMTGDSRGGLAWLSGKEAAWAHCNNFRFHVWWHKALMHLDQGDHATVLDLYDHKIRAEHTDDYRDISNATSLLMRLELEGVPVGNRWEELADLSESRVGDGCLIFADLHYLLALVSDDRDAAAHKLVARIVADGQAQATDYAPVFDHPGVAAAHGLEAFGEGNYAQAFQSLTAARPAMQRAGGSHAQRDVFERITIDAGIRAGQLGPVEDILAARSALRDGAEDSFARQRREMINDLRRPAMAVPAQ